MSTWQVCPLDMCVPTGVCVSVGARRQAATKLLIPPSHLPLHMQVQSHDSNNTSHRNMYYFLQTERLASITIDNAAYVRKALCYLRGDNSGTSGYA